MSREDLQRKPVGRGTIINNVYTKLKNDEQLLRLLHYGYKDKDGNYVDCLDENLADIKGQKNYHNIVKDHLLKTVKQDEIVSVKDCFLLIHSGKRRPVFGNHLLATQEILIDVVVHNDFQEDDNRLDDICDRLDYLIVHERFGLGRMEISTPIPYEAPRGYYRHQLKYVYTDTKK